MKKFLGLGCVALMLCFVSGCGGKNADALIKEQTVLMNDYADAVDKKDDAKAKDVEAKIMESNKKLEALKLSDDE